MFTLAREWLVSFRGHKREPVTQAMTPREAGPCSGLCSRDAISLRADNGPASFADSWVINPSSRIASPPDASCNGDMNDNSSLPSLVFSPRENPRPRAGSIVRVIRRRAWLVVACALIGEAPHMLWPLEPPVSTRPPHRYISIRISLTKSLSACHLLSTPIQHRRKTLTSNWCNWAEARPNKPRVSSGMATQLWTSRRC